jgi:hypothetical protein
MEAESLKWWRDEVPFALWSITNYCKLPVGVDLLFDAHDPHCRVDHSATRVWLLHEKGRGKDFYWDLVGLGYVDTPLPSFRSRPGALALLAKFNVEQRVVVLSYDHPDLLLCEQPFLSRHATPLTGVPPHVIARATGPLPRRHR